MTAFKKGAAWASAFVIMFALSCSGKKQEGPQAQAIAGQTSAGPDENTADEQSSGRYESARAACDWEESFRFVRDNIRTEPSRFPLKTAEGVRWGRSGNSLEKALLLAQLLEEGGLAVRIVEGEMDDRAAEKLLSTIFPPGKEFSYKKNVPLSAPAKDPDLIAAVKRHFWVEREDGEKWIDLDPAFPGAKPGQAFASAVNTFEPADEALKTRVSIVLEYAPADSGDPQAVLNWEGPLEEAADKAVSLTIVAEFRKAAEKEEEESEGAAGVFGALGGQSSKKKKGPAGEIVSYNAALTVNGEGVADGQFSPEKGEVDNLSLKIKFEGLGEVVSASERILFEKTEAGAAAPVFQRHSILIAPNRIPAESWQARLKETTDTTTLADIKSQVEEIKKSLKAKKINQAVLDKSSGLEQKMGAEIGHLLNMIFASTSDDQTEQEGISLSIGTYYQVPRILITTFSGDQDKSVTAFDLRQDRIEAVPLPGQALNMKQTFLYGRGVMESILEGKLLELLTGTPALTTAALMREAAEQQIPIRSYSRLDKENLQKTSPPEGVAAKLISVLDSGRVVIIPEKSIDWGGQERWGWWDVDPRTMETVGVMDTGLHQAMIQRSILDSKGPLESKMGMVIGAIVGAVDTQWMLAGMVLKYGELNKAALEEAKAYMKQIDEVMCPGIEEKISVGVGVTLIEMEDCFTIGYEVGLEAGVEISQAWCENFAKGFACASTTILNYYLSQVEE